MAKRVIIMDTASAPTSEIIKKYNPLIMGMKVHMDGKVYTDGDDLSQDDFYSRVESAKEVNTSPPLVGEIKKHYQALQKEGYDEAISIHVSSKMSKLITVCNNAKNMMQRLNVKIIDTENVSVGSYLVAEKIMELLDRGKSYEDLLPLLPEIRRSAFMQISLSTLKYLVKSGRIGRAQGVVGSLLRMKPILGIDKEGYLSTISKERSKEVVINAISDNAVEFLSDRPHNVKIYYTYGLDKNKSQVESIYEIFMEKFKKLNVKNYKVLKGRLMPTIACLSGPATYGFAVYGEKEPID